MIEIPLMRIGTSMVCLDQPIYRMYAESSIRNRIQETLDSRDLIQTHAVKITREPWLVEALGPRNEDGKAVMAFDRDFIILAGSCSARDYIPELDDER